MRDFDRLFSEYILNWHMEKGKQLTEQQMELMANELYNTWADTPSPKLGGIAPRQFFAEIANPESLITALKDYCASPISPPALLLDEIVKRENTEGNLLEIVRKAEEGELTMLAVNLLLEKGYEGLADEVFTWVFDEKKVGDLREVATEIVAQRADKFLNETLKRMSSTDAYGQELAIDILVNAPYDERVYKKLVELFVGGENVPLYASYLGKYGNPECVELLLRSAEDCNYLDFLEIRSAVESLGGEFEISRDFSEDAYYKALKGIKD